MQNSLFVAGLPFAMEDEELNQLFSKHGNVKSAKIIRDRDSGRSKGYAFVDMSSEEEAQNCIKNLHETNFGGRNIAVKIKEENAPRKSGNFNDRNRGDRGGRSSW